MWRYAKIVLMLFAVIREFAERGIRVGVSGQWEISTREPEKLVSAYIPLPTRICKRRWLL